MSPTDCKRLDALIEIAEEDRSPMNDRQREFVMSLDDRRDRELSPKQAEWFDALVDKHLRNPR